MQAVAAPWGRVTESQGDSHLGDSGEVLSQQHTRACFDSSLAQNGFWCPSVYPQGDDRDRLLGAHGQAGTFPGNHAALMYPQFEADRKEGSGIRK